MSERLGDLCNEQQTAHVSLGLIVAASNAPANLHERWNGDRHVRCHDAAADETRGLKRNVAQQTDATFTDILNPSDELDGHGLPALHRRQTSGLDFQRVRKSDVLTSLAFSGAGHIVIMREPSDAVNSSIGLVR